MADTVTLDIDGKTAVITLNRPNAMNALTGDLLGDLLAAVEEADERDVRAILLTGAGDAFSAGGDLNRMQDLAAEAAEKHAETAEAITTLLETTAKMTVAAIDGPCLGGGHELALACDFRIATEDATFGQPEIQVGLIPGFGATARLPRMIGWARAKSMILSGRTIDAAEAREIGLVDELVESDVVAAAKRFAADIYEKQSPVAYEYTKKALHHSQNLSLEDALSKERAFFEKVFGTRDQQEGITAFLEGRDPDFPGE
jgi:enoyl-CoA hydratase/carnithine racemase